jgi:hypothetical protein
MLVERTRRHSVGEKGNFEILAHEAQVECHIGRNLGNFLSFHFI